MKAKNVSQNKPFFVEMGVHRNNWKGTYKINSFFYQHPLKYIRTIFLYFYHI